VYSSPSLIFVQLTEPDLCTAHRAYQCTAHRAEFNRIQCTTWENGRALPLDHALISVLRNCHVGLYLNVPVVASFMITLSCSPHRGVSVRSRVPDLVTKFLESYLAPKVHCLLHKSPLLAHMLDEINAAHTLTSCSVTTLRSTAPLSSKNFAFISWLSMHVTCSAPQITFGAIVLKQL
jgi:hypothetical protein